MVEGTCPICGGTLIATESDYGFECEECSYPEVVDMCSGGECSISFTEED